MIGMQLLLFNKLKKSSKKDDSLYSKDFIIKQISNKMCLLFSIDI